MNRSRFLIALTPLFLLSVNIAHATSMLPRPMPPPPPPPLLPLHLNFTLSFFSIAFDLVLFCILIGIIYFLRSFIEKFIFKKETLTALIAAIVCAIGIFLYGHIQHSDNSPSSAQACLPINESSSEVFAARKLLNSILDTDALINAAYPNPVSKYVYPPSYQFQRFLDYHDRQFYLGSRPLGDTNETSGFRLPTGTLAVFFQGYDVTSLASWALPYAIVGHNVASYYNSSDTLEYFELLPQGFISKWLFVWNGKSWTHSLVFTNAKPYNLIGIISPSSRFIAIVDANKGFDLKIYDMVSGVQVFSVNATDIGLSLYDHATSSVHWGNAFSNEVLNIKFENSAIARNTNQPIVASIDTQKWIMTIPSLGIDYPGIWIYPQFIFGHINEHVGIAYGFNIPPSGIATTSATIDGKFLPILEQENIFTTPGEKTASISARSNSGGLVHVEQKIYIESPAAYFVTPNNGATATGTINLALCIADSSMLGGTITLYKDSDVIATSTNVNNSYSYLWNTKNELNGQHALTAAITAATSSVSANINLIVADGIEPPKQPSRGYNAMILSVWVDSIFFGIFIALIFIMGFIIRKILQLASPSKHLIVRLSYIFGWLSVASLLGPIASKLPITLLGLNLYLANLTLPGLVLAVLAVITGLIAYVSRKTESRWGMILGMIMICASIGLLILVGGTPPLCTNNLVCNMLQGNSSCIRYFGDAGANDTHPGFCAPPPPSSPILYI